MKQYEKYGMMHETEFMRKVTRAASKFNARMKELMSVEYDRRSFLKQVYITWMLKQPVVETVPLEVRRVYEIALTKTAEPKVNAGCCAAAVQELEEQLLSAVDSVLPLFGKDVENEWFVKPHLLGMRWGFVELISQIAVSELLSDTVVGIVDSSKWRKHWRGGML